MSDGNRQSLVYEYFVKGFVHGDIGGKSESRSEDGPRPSIQVVLLWILCRGCLRLVIHVETFRRPWGDFNASLQRPSMTTKVSWVCEHDCASPCFPKPPKTLKTYQDVKIIRWTFVVQNVRSLAFNFDLGGNHVVGGFVLRRHRLMGTFLMLG